MNEKRIITNKHGNISIIEINIVSTHDSSIFFQSHNEEISLSSSTACLVVCIIWSQSLTLYLEKDYDFTSFRIIVNGSCYVIRS